MSLQMKGTFPGYYRPDGPVKVQVAKTWQTEPSTLPIIGTAPGGWLHVRLPQRPDQLTAWIHASDGVEVQTPYRIVVNLKTTHLQLYKLNRLVLDVPAGVGAADTPTPLGHYFVAFLEPPIGPEYGAFIMITSAHSQVIQSWEGTGDAIVAIHGPIGADAEIGTTGAYISNGCVRLHDNDLLHLQDVPPGTPIDIVD
jgi:lipoprotein-anchoring transpeptidase ErfK/SrfK